MSAFVSSVRAAALSVQIPGGLPPFLWGEPGEAKSAAFAQLALALNRNLVSRIPAHMAPEDIGGLPVPDAAGRVQYQPPAWAEEAAQAPSIILFDECTNCPPRTWGGILDIITGRRVGAQALPDHVALAAAGNPASSAADYNELSRAAANRFVHLSWPGPSGEEWSAWAAGQAGVMAHLPVLDTAAYRAALPAAMAAVAGFIRRRPELIRESADKSEGRELPAWTSPRTLEQSARLLAACKVAACEDLLPALLAGTIGDPTALELQTWIRECDLPDPETLLSAPTSWAPDQRRPDRDWAILTSVVSAALHVDGKATAAHVTRYRAAWSILDRASAADGPGGDVVLTICQPLVSQRTKLESATKTPLLDPTTMAIVARLAPISQAAGIIK